MVRKVLTTLGVRTEPDLLMMSPAAGCGCKLPMHEMEGLMATVDSLLQGQNPGNVRLDSRARDDAALYDVGNGVLHIASLDFGTPVSSDPAVWGRIAALNALSDIYAMGGIPLYALGIVGWPARMPGQALSVLLHGAVEALNAEATPLLGGHTITSEVPLFGLSVTGRSSPDTVMLVGGAKPYQRLLVTKPLGTGVITTAQKAALASVAAIEESEQVMLSSNRTASRLAVEAGIRTATDITGYGLVGHLHTMLNQSGCAAVVNYDAVPVLEAARVALVRDGLVPNSAERNYLSLDARIDWSDTPLATRFLCCDPQTSGGLLLCADDAAADTFLATCRAADQFAVEIGRVAVGEPGRITVTRDPDPQRR